MSVRDWIGYPIEALGEWALRANSWMHELAALVNSNEEAIAALQADHTDWQTFAPTLTNFSGTATCEYSVKQGEVTYQGTIAVTSVSSGTLLVSLPVAGATSPQPLFSRGTCVLDNAAGSTAGATIRVELTGTDMTFWDLNGDGLQGAALWSTTYPTTLASGMIFYFYCTYRAA